MQALAGIEVKTSALDGHILRLGADEVHLDARFALVEERPMDKARRVDVTVQLVADALQQVEVERGGDMGAVVVGRFQHRPILTRSTPITRPPPAGSTSCRRCRNAAASAGVKLPMLEPGKNTSGCSLEKSSGRFSS